MKINTLNALPAAGKTTVTVQHIAEHFGSTLHHVIWVSPTIVLLNSIKTMMIDNGIPASDIIIITSDQTTNVADELRDFRFSPNKNKILLVASPSARWIGEYKLPCDLLVVDEEYPVLTTNSGWFSEDSSRLALMKYLSFDQDTSFDTLMRVTPTKKMSSIDRDDFVYQNAFKQIFDLIESEQYDVFATTIDVNKYAHGESDTLQFFSILKPDFVSGAKDILYLGFNMENTLLGLIYSKLYGVTFQHSLLEDKLLFRHYSGKVDVRYLIDGSMGNKRIEEEGLAPKIAKHIKDNVKSEALYRWNYKGKDPISGRNFTFKAPANWQEIPAVAHGLNKPEWMAMSQVVLMNGFRPNGTENKFLKEIGITQADANKARHGSMIVQELTRSAIRHNKDITVYVVDHFTATLIAELLDGSDVTITKMSPTFKYEAKTRGRPKKYLTPEEKKEAKREDNRLRAQRNRDKKKQEKK